MVLHILCSYLKQTNSGNEIVLNHVKTILVKNLSMGLKWKVALHKEK